MAKHALYDAAVREVRGEASSDEKRRLSADVVEWRNALQSVIDELDAQAVVEQDKFEDATFGFEPEDEEYVSAEEQHVAWKGRMRTFKKHITARLMAVKRMCQEEAEGGASQVKIVNLAVDLLEADSGTESEWETAVNNLLVAVEDYLAGS